MLEETIEFAILRVLADNAAPESPEFVTWGLEIAGQLRDARDKDPAGITVRIMRIESRSRNEYVMVISYPG